MKRPSFFAALALTGALYACGGGGGGTSSIPGGSGGGGGGGPVPTSNTASVPVGNAATVAALPAVGGYTGLVTIPAANATTTVTITASTVAPAGVPALQNKARRVMGASTNTPLLYLSFVPQQAVTLAGSPTAKVTLPSSVDSSQLFFVAYYAGTRDGWITVAGPIKASGQDLQLKPDAGSVPVSAANPLLLALYAGGPLAFSGPLAVDPANVQLLDTSASAILSVYQGYSPFTIDASKCAGIATASFADSSDFTITAKAAGKCTVTVRDAHGQSLDVPVSVTSSTVGVQ